MTTRRDEIEKIIEDEHIYVNGKNDSLVFITIPKQVLAKRIHASEVAMLKPVREALKDMVIQYGGMVGGGVTEDAGKAVYDAEKALATLDAIIGEEKNV